MSAYIAPIGMIIFGAFLLGRYYPSTPSTSHEKRHELPSAPKSRYRSLRPHKLPSLSPYKSSSIIVRAAGARTGRTVSAFDAPYQYFQDQLSTLRNCMQVQNCAYPHTDPKSYNIGVYRETATTLGTLKEWQLRNGYKDARIPPLMVKFLSFNNAEINQLALEILATQDTNPKLVDPILTYVIENPQPDAIPIAIRELSRYQEPKQRDKIDERIEDVLLHGAVHSAVEIARSIQPLINDSNRHKYRSISRQLNNIPFGDEIADELSKSL